ncbi:MAG TPA: hypothetical protein VK158_04205 [Acidobacteriota bacterium]|nr:hypothetical protein [Acidobacteriota bacterium]
MAKDSTLDKIIVCMGFQNQTEFFLKYVLPVFSGMLIALTLCVLFLTSVKSIVFVVLFILGLITMVVYPLIIFEQIKMEIDENMHLFITFAGSISTLDIQRNILFKKIAEKEAFGALSDVAKKIMYLAKSWNLGFATACRKMGKIVPSKVLGDFLDRFAIMMDFGQSLQVFLHDEQIAVMDDYAVEYKKSLERIRTTQDIFLALTMALSFMMSIGLLLPLISNTDVNIVVYYILATVIIIDMMVVLFVYNFIPADTLCHNLKHKDAGTRRIEKAMYISLPISMIGLVFLTYINWLPFIANIAISIIPLFFVGTLAQAEEEEVYKRDKSYAAFIRSLGSGIEVRQGAIVSSLYALQVHDFGPLNEMSIALYRRLRTGNNKMKAWDLFGAESGSNLIVQFTNIFAEAVSLGGSAEKIGEIISVNFQKLLALRKLRIQLSSALRGALYGGMVGFSMSAYVAAQITDLLGGILSNPMNGVESGDLGSLIGNAAPVSSFSFNIEKILFVIGIMVMVHAVASGLIIKIVEGGSMYAAFFDICILIWIGATMGLALPWMLEKLLPGLKETFGVDPLAT